MLRLHQKSSGASVDGGGNDQRGSFDLFDGIDVVHDDRVHEGTIETVRGADDNMKVAVIDGEDATLRQTVKQIVRLLTGQLGGRRAEGTRETRDKGQVK